MSSSGGSKEPACAKRSRVCATGFLRQRLLWPTPASPPHQVLVRLAFGIDASRNVAMKLAVRSESADVSEAIHAIIQEA